MFKKLTKSEIKEMSTTLSEAFVGHSNFQVIANKKRRKRLLYHSFMYMNKVINHYGEIYIAKKGDIVVGYISFIKESDQEQISFKRIVKTGGLGDVMKFLFNNTYSSLQHFISYLKTYNAHQSANSESTIHLLSTGIDPLYRGMGIMSKAFKDCFVHYKELGYEEVVLETSDKSNLPIYQKLGFQMEEVITKKQTIYFMKMEL